MCDPVFLLCLDVYMIMCLVLNKNILKKTTALSRLPLIWECMNYQQVSLKQSSQEMLAGSLPTVHSCGIHLLLPTQIGCHTFKCNSLPTQMVAIHSSAIHYLPIWLPYILTTYLHGCHTFQCHLLPICLMAKYQISPAFKEYCPYPSLPLGCGLKFVLIAYYYVNNPITSTFFSEC